jgi:hypothetical protein
MNLVEHSPSLSASNNHPDRLWIHPVSYPLGTADSFPEIKRLESEADYSPPSTAEVKKTLIYTSTPPYVSMV